MPLPEPPGRTGPLGPAQRATHVPGLSNGRLGPVPATALSLAFGARASRLSTRATVLALTMAIAVVGVGAVLLTSLRHATDDPAHFGWTFDAKAGNPFEQDPGDLFDMVQKTPGIASAAKATEVSIDVGGNNLAIVAVEADHGVPFVIVDGEAPTGTNQIAVGRRTLGALGMKIGDTVVVDGGSGPTDFIITGTAVIPEIGTRSESGLGEGGVMTLAALQAVDSGVQPNLALLRFAPGRTDSAIAAFADLTGQVQPVARPYRPAALYQLMRIRSLPVIVGVLIVVLALATMVQAIGGSGRVRRRELAVLKVLGFTRAQVTKVILFQAASFVVLALAVGIPLGLGLGRLSWDAIQRRLGVPYGARLPGVVTALIVPAALLLATLVASVPAWWAARRRTAHGLRTD